MTTPPPIAANEKNFKRSVSSSSSGIGDAVTPIFSNFDVDDAMNFGDLPTPADRSDSVASIFNPPPPGLSSIYDKWELPDDYQIERIIGRGSYGEVVQALDLR
jgi:hypothetical protein